MNRLGFIVSYLLLLSFLSSASLATAVFLPDLQTMAGKSDVVVHGVVGNRSVHTDHLGRLITLTEIEVIEGFYGAKAKDIIKVYQVGGQKDGVMQPAIGGQKFQLGQEVFFFGMKLKDAYVSFGIGQGKLDVFWQHGQQVVKEDLGTVDHVMSRYGRNNNFLEPNELFYSDKELFKKELRLIVSARK